VASVTRPLLVAVLAFAAFVLIYPQVRDRLPHSLSYERSSSSQSSSQLSTEEFAQIDSSFTPEKLGRFAGEPADKTKA
jgi:hypothetical protein